MSIITRRPHPGSRRNTPGGRGERAVSGIGRVGARILFVATSAVALVMLATLGEDGAVVAVVLLWVLLFGAVAGSIWRNKGGAYASGFMWGAVFGFLGLLYVGLAKPRGASLGRHMRECPWCLEPMRAEARVCPHCQRESEPAFTP
jgi:hypothetical protein